MTLLCIQENISLKELTTLKIGGEARYFVSVANVDELKDAVAFAKEKRVPFVALGGGSNVLISDARFQGLVIKNEIKGIEWMEGKLKNKSEKGKTKEKEESENNVIFVIAGAGENWDRLAAAAVERGLWGIENLSGIPGTVGGAPIQNIGAYGVELAEALEWVEIFDSKNLEMRRLQKDECRFGYRESVFKKPEGKHFIITRVALRLKNKSEPNIRYKDLRTYFSEKGIAHPSLLEMRRAVLEIRAKKFPDLRQFGTAGSFFKNPIIPQAQFDELKKKYPDLPGFELRVSAQGGSSSGGKDKGLRIKIPLAWVLDNICGLKGMTKNKTGLFERQSIVLINFGGATEQEVSAFALTVARRVKEMTGIEIELEVAFIGDDKSHPALDAGSRPWRNLSEEISILHQVRDDKK